MDNRNWYQKAMSYLLTKLYNALYRLSHKAEELADELNMLCYRKYAAKPVQSEPTSMLVKEALKILDSHLQFVSTLDRSYDSSFNENAKATVKVKRPKSYMGETKVGYIGIWLTLQERNSEAARKALQTS